ncbi:unnamed protein product, partial [marine sediment metagenome]
WGELGLSKRWQWSRTKTRKFLNDLEKEQQIGQQKSKVITVVTIINYDRYQAKKTTDDTTERQQKNIYKNVKNNNIYIDHAKTTIDHFNLKAEKKIGYGGNHLKHIVARLKEGFTLKDMFAVIDIKVSKWKYNPKMSDYLRISTLFCKAHFEEYLNEDKKIEDNPGMYDIDGNLITETK